MQYAAALNVVMGQGNLGECYEKNELRFREGVIALIYWRGGYEHSHGGCSTDYAYGAEQ